jgi:phage baseplate assembly protein W
MRPEFGCHAQDLVFEPHNVATEALLQKYVAEALTRWEPRIEVQGVNVVTDNDLEGGLLTEIFYTVKATHDRRSIVYPFFLVGEESW